MVRYQAAQQLLEILPFIILEAVQVPHRGLVVSLFITLATRSKGMKNIIRSLSLGIVISLFTTISFSNAGSMFNSYSNVTNGGFNKLESELLINRPEIGNKMYSPICFGCLSSTTGLPRTEYVRPHYRSNGTYVGGYYRSRR